MDSSEFKGKVAIIGTRNPTQDQAKKAEAYTMGLCGMGFVIATGAAYGIDAAAMRGAFPGQLEVYLPWVSYNSTIIPEHAKRIVYDPSIHRMWTDSVDKYHPQGSILPPPVRKLMARNYGIIEGCIAVAAYPKSAGDLGGTGQGLRIADALGIPYLAYVSEMVSWRKGC